MKEKTITLDQLVRWVGVGLLVLGILLLVNYLSSVLLPFFVAWLLAYLLYPMVKFVQYKLHVGNRALSIVITLVFVIALLGGVIYLIIPPMIEQFEKLGSLATDYIQKEAHIRDIPSAIQDWINQNNRECAGTDGYDYHWYRGVAHHLIIYVLHPAGLRVSY